MTTLMVASQQLTRAAWSGRLPDVQPGQAFWAKDNDVGWLTANAMATLAPPGTTPPPAEPPHTVNGTPGFGVGVSNCTG